MAKLHDYVTNSKYKEIFEILGNSKEPLLISQIIQRIENKKNRGKEVYRMIKELTSNQNDRLLLFEWNKIIKSDNADRYYHKTVRKLDKVFALNWGTKDNDYIKNNITITMENDRIQSGCNRITISYGQNNKVMITLDTKDKDKGELRIIDEGRRRTRPYPIIVERNNIGVYLYIEVIANLNPVRYLLTIHKEDNRSISEAKKDIYFATEFQMLSLPDVSDFRTDRANWKYRLCIRSLLVYILSEIHFEGEEKKKKEKRREKRRRIAIHNRNIDNLLYNLSRNYVEEYPFLLYYKDLKRVFDILERSGYDNAKNFQVRALREIAEELRHFLDKSKIEELIYWVTKRYHDKIEHFLWHNTISSLTIPLIENQALIDIDTCKKICTYQSEIRAFLQRYQMDETEKENTISRYYIEKNNSSLFARELDSIVNADRNNSQIISISQIAKKYSIPETQSSKIATAYSDKYIISSMHLIPYLKVDKLKLSLSDNIMHYDTARSFLKMEGIPEECHPDVIRTLQFDFLNLNGSNPNTTLVTRILIDKPPLIRRQIIYNIFFHLLIVL